MNKSTFFKIHTKGKLLAGASLISLAMATSVSAQDSTWWASVEGAALTRDGDGIRTEDQYLNPESSVSFAAEVGYNAPGSVWSYGIGIRQTTSSEDGYSYRNYGYLYTDDATVTETITSIDLEIGRDIGIGSFQGRGTLGVRSLGYDATAEGHYYDGWDGDEADYEYTTSFSGIGPRLAVEGQFPLGNNLSVDAEAGVAVLFGTRTQSSDAFNSYDGDSYYSYDSDEIVSNTDASVAVSYQIGEKSKISLGYRTDIYTNLDNSGGKGGSSDSLIHSGAFLKYTQKF